MTLRRRAEVRYVPPQSLPVEVHIMGEESLNILYARDISLSGLGVRVPHGLESSDLGREVELVITLPGFRSFLARGVVRHRNSAASVNFFGVEFTGMKPEHREQIRRFIRRLVDLQETRGE